MNQNEKRHPLEVIVLLCGVGGVISVFLPWVDVLRMSSQQYSLFDMAGKIGFPAIFWLLILVIFASIMGCWLSFSSSRYYIGTGIFLALSAMFAIIFEDKLIQEFRSFGEKSTGYYVALICGLAGAITAFILPTIKKEFHQGRSETEASPDIKTTAPSAAALSAAEELKIYKDLLDLGAITSEEYQENKEQLMRRMRGET